MTDNEDNYVDVSLCLEHCSGADIASKGNAIHYNRYTFDDLSALCKRGVEYICWILEKFNFFLYYTKYTGV